jgi:hypothetical protein
MALTPEDLEQIRAVVASAIEPLARSAALLSGDLEEFREEVAEQFIDLRADVAKLRVQVDRATRCAGRLTRRLG